MIKIIEVKVLLKIREFLESGGYDLVLVDFDHYDGVLVCVQSAEIIEKLSIIESWKQISRMRTNSSIRIWADRMPYTPHFFVRRKLKTVLKHIEETLGDEIEFEPYRPKSK